MAFIRNCFVIAVMLFCVLFTNAQTVSYPVNSSQLLKSTAEDAALLLQKAITGSQFTITMYTAMPLSGIIFIYDSAITDNQACKIESDGSGYIKFTAQEDNGLCFGLYQYLQQLGFRFYQPGSIWEIIPELKSAYRKTDSTYTSDFKYRSWYISGGHSRWVMDSNNNYGWDSYAGENGHNWSLYQRRNGMTGGYKFTGHRSDILTGINLAIWQNNPCYVASYDTSRVVNSQSVPDVNNESAKLLWSSIIEQKHTQYKNNILNNSVLYVNQLRSLNYNYENIGIEVPDGAHWGNSIDNKGCSNIPYAKESDQQFTLANYTAQKISPDYPNARFQVYAYSTHADVPSTNITLNKNIDVQLIPAVYQNLTSTNGLRNRWYKRTRNISEYNYLNLGDWSGETPAFYLDDFKATVQIAKDAKSQGLVWETSPAKFASLPFLLAANNNLVNNVLIDNTLQEFCSKMFTKAGKTIYELMQIWTDNKYLAGGTSNRYKVSLYLQILEKAEMEIQGEPEIVSERLRELKAYVHYMILYYDWAADQSPNEKKIAKAARLCMYLAQINKLQLVNSYYLIFSISRKYALTSDFYLQYNVVSGLAYQNGSLSLITTAEIENNFQTDKADYINLVNDYTFESTADITNQFATAGLIASKKIAVKLTYTNGMDYYNRTELNIIAPTAGNFTINYSPTFEMPDKGYINFTVESTDKAMNVIEDITLDKNAKAGSITISLPVAGNYKMTVSSKYKSSVELGINTNKNIFYKSGSVLGKATEVYKTEADMPGYLYIPKGISKLYFSIPNSSSGGTGFKTEEYINAVFNIQDNTGKKLKARFVTPNDSALFYIEIPQYANDKFCRITQKYYYYNMIFSNISNYMWYADIKPLPCSNADFTVEAVNKSGNCITQLTAIASSGQFNWEVNDLGKTYTYSNQRVVELPANSSPNAVVTLTNGSNCSITKTIGSDEKFLKAKQACSAIEKTPEIAIVPVIYPNPSTGIFKCMQSGVDFYADQVVMFNANGNSVAVFNSVKQFNISQVAAGIYWYKIVVKGTEFTGKLIKL